MKRKSLVVLTLLIVASLMAGIGTGALDVFSANRASAMKVVNDGSAYIGLSGDGKYAYETNNGQLKIDFTSNNPYVIGDGFNPQARSEFNEVFTVTNQSAKTVYVWLEAKGWSSQHNSGLVYRINNTDGIYTPVNEWYRNNPEGKNLLSSTGTNYNDGVGKMAYVKLEPGQYFNVKILVKTEMSNGYGDPNTPYSDWGHTVIVKANSTAPTQN